MIYNRAEEGFPHGKVDLATRWLFSTKPYWMALTSGVRIVPSDTPAFPGEPYAAMASSDGKGRIYIDRTFAVNASISELATAIEFQYHMYFRRFWERFSDVPLEDWHRLVPPAMSMEITSTLINEYKHTSTRLLKEHGIKTRVPNGGFLAHEIGVTEREVELYNLDHEPLLSTGENIGALIPERMGFKNGLSAERYIELIREREEAERKAFEEQEEDLASEDTADDLSGSQGGSQEGSEQPAEPEDTCDPDGDHEGDGVGKGEADQEADENVGSECDQGSDNHSDNNKAEQDNSGDNFSADSPSADEGDDARESAEDVTGQGHDDSDVVDGEQESGSGPAVDENGAGSDEGNAGSADGLGAADDPGLINKKAQESVLDMDSQPDVFADVMNSRMSLFFSSFHNNDDELDVNHMIPDVMIFDNEELDEALLEESLPGVYDAYSMVSPDPRMLSDEKISPDDGSMEALALANRRKSKHDFISRLNMSVNSKVDSARISGSQDTSLAVRNPNQPMVGVVMPGEYEESPTIYVLQDVSGSMSGGKAYAAGLAVQDVINAVASQNDSEVTWVAADFLIRNVTKTSLWEDEDIFKMAFAPGGATDLSKIFAMLCEGGLVWDGQHYPEPDTVFFVTDGQFAWPDKRPVTNCNWLVITMPECLKYMPSWMKKDEILLAY